MCAGPSSSLRATTARTTTWPAGMAARPRWRASGPCLKTRLATVWSRRWALARPWLVWTGVRPPVSGRPGHPMSGRSPTCSTRGPSWSTPGAAGSPTSSTTRRLRPPGCRAAGRSSCSTHSLPPGSRSPRRTRARDGTAGMTVASSSSPRSRLSRTPTSRTIAGGPATTSNRRPPPASLSR